MRVIHSTSVLIALVACSNNNNPATDAAIVHDAPVTHFDSPMGHDAPPPPDAPVTRQAQVAIAESTGPNGAMAEVSATVVEGGLYGTVIGTDGPCTISMEVANPPTVSAGAISVTGTTTAFTLTPTGAAPHVSYGVSPTPASPLYTTGATITITAAGADFPAFSGTVTAPAVLAGFTAPTTVSRAGYTASWTAGSGPKVWVIMAGFDGSTATFAICRVDDTGTFAVPASTFAMVPAGDTQVAVGVARVSENQLGTPDVSLVAVSETTSNFVPLTQ